MKNLREKQKYRECIMNLTYCHSFHFYTFFLPLPQGYFKANHPRYYYHFIHTVSWFLPKLKSLDSLWKSIQAVSLPSTVAFKTVSSTPYILTHHLYGKLFITGTYYKSSDFISSSNIQLAN